MSVSAVVVTRGDVHLYRVLASIPEAWEIIVWDNSFGGQVVRWGPADGLATDELGLRRDSEVLVLKTAGDLAVYGRYAAIEHATGDLIYVQDDDVVLSPASIKTLVNTCLWQDRCYACDEDDPYEQCTCGEPLRWRGVVCNMPARFRAQPQYASGEHALVGFGAVFHRDAPARAFERFWAADPDPWLHHPLAGFKHDESPARDHFLRTCDIVFTALTPRVLVDVAYEDLPWASAPNRMWKQPQHVAERQRMLELVRQVRDAEPARV